MKQTYDWKAKSEKQTNFWKTKSEKQTNFWKTKSEKQTNFSLLIYNGIYVFVFPLKNIDCGYSWEPPWRGGSNEFPQSVLSRNTKKKKQKKKTKKKTEFFMWKFSFFGGKILNIFD